MEKCVRSRSPLISLSFFRVVGAVRGRKSIDRFVLFAFLLLFCAIYTSAHAAGRPVVAVIDSGVARTAELQDVLVAEYDLAADPARPAFEPRFDHGTYVATVLHRAAKGGVDIVSLRIDDPADCPDGVDPPCQPAAAPIVAAIDKAVELGADAINMSLNLKRDASIDAAVRAAAAAGVPVVMAAGNQGAAQPANLSAAIAGHPATILVGALDRFGEPWERSNKPDSRSGADYTFAWRPGVEIETAGADGTSVHASGTSLAAPMETASLFVGRSRKPVQDASSTIASGEEPPLEPTAVTSASAISGDNWFRASDIHMIIHLMCAFALAVAWASTIRKLSTSGRRSNR